MRYSILFLFLLISCGTPEPQNDSIDEKISEIDSVVTESQLKLVKTDSISLASEKLITEKINNTVEKITSLEKEIEVARESVKNVKTITVRDTVYIETKKNFWGKEKTSTKSVTDSSVTEDSTTIKQNGN